MTDCQSTVCFCNNYNRLLKAAKLSAIEVENHRETIVELQAEHGFEFIKEGDIHPLECNVEIKNDGICPCVREFGCNIKKLAFVSISAEKPKEESEPEAIVELEDYIDSLFFPKDAQKVMHYLKSNFTITRK